MPGGEDRRGGAPRSEALGTLDGATPAGSTSSAPPDKDDGRKAAGRRGGRPPSGPRHRRRSTSSGGASGGKRAPFRLGNRPPLTGIRAPLIIAVMLYHSNGTIVKGAWSTMSTFFVLSGFLITSLLMGEGRRTGRIRLGNFYARRATRLLPPVLLTVALLGVYAAFVPVSNAGSRLWGDGVATMFYFADYRSAFGHEPIFGYIGQAWSLSVEEQFYVIWSLSLFAVMALHKRKAAWVLSVTGILACTANRLWIVFHAASWPGHNDIVAARVYYAFDTRADALFLGCALGLIATAGWLDGWRPWMRKALTVAAAVAGATMVWVLWNVDLLARSIPIVWIPVTELASAVFIVYFVVCPMSLGSRIVGLGALVFLGNLSYTLYLIHWAVFLEVNQSRFPWGFWPVELLRLAIVMSIATLSWFLMERPLMRWRRGSVADRAPPAAQPTGAALSPAP